MADQQWRNTATGQATDNFQYGYDPNGNVMYRDNTVNPAFGELYHASGAGQGYDALNRLTAFARGVLSASGAVPDTIASPTHGQSWALDAVGNFSGVTTDGATQSNTQNRQNELTAAGGSALAYDGAGNTTTDEHGHTLTYDAWNRLVGVSGPDGSETFGYDALSRRISAGSGPVGIEGPAAVGGDGPVTVGGGAGRDLYYSAAWQVLEERSSGQTQAQYVWSPVYVDALVERDRSTAGNGVLDERLYPQQDANWNVTALVDVSGTVAERYADDAYGTFTVMDGSWNARAASQYGWVYQSQGRRWDAFSQTFDGRWRVYDPATGTWKQSDPTGLAAGVNSYGYEGQGPTGRVDPSGLEDIPAHLITINRVLGGDGTQTSPVAINFTPIGYKPLPPVKAKSHLQCAYEVGSAVASKLSEGERNIENISFWVADSLYRNLAPSDMRSKLGTDLRSFINWYNAPQTKPLRTNIELAISLSMASPSSGGIQFGQRGVSSVFRNGEFAGKTIEEVTGALRSGCIKPSQLPLQTITRDGITYTLNNRSLMALRQAGMAPQTIIDVTGNTFFEQQLTERLAEMGGQIPPGFTPVIRGGGK